MSTKCIGVQFKNFLKSFSVLVALKRKIWFLFDPACGTTKLNVVEAFPLYLPNSAGNYRDKSELTLKTINQIFPSLSSFVEFSKNKKIIVESVEEFSSNLDRNVSAVLLKELLDAHGSDKANRHNYHHLYAAILSNPKAVEGVFEIGLGSNNTDVVSNMGSNGRPGASLRAFRDYCPNAFIYGADVDKRILFEDERIKTFFIDQTKRSTFEDLLTNLPDNFDLIIDDGLHSPDANVASLEFGMKLVKVGGWVVVEDIASAAISFWHIVSNLLQDNYESHIISADGGIVFAVKRLR